MKSTDFFQVFNQSIDDYHVHDSIETKIINPYSKDQFEYLLYQKNWIDTVQWHLEDIIRDPEIEPAEALKIKRVIDASNQKRTDLVEFIDGYFLNKYKDVIPGYLYLACANIIYNNMLKLDFTQKIPILYHLS